MFSKYLSARSPFLSRAGMLVSPRITNVRVYGYYIPPNQYDMPRPKRLQLMYTVKTYWETIPLFLTIGSALAIVFLSILWACKNKVDIVFTTHSRDNISRTMDLRNPTAHKLLLINQRYEAWPEMQAVLDKMKAAEKRNKIRAQFCSIP